MCPVARPTCSIRSGWPCWRCFGLVRGSFIPPKDLRELRLVSRYRRKLSATCASQVNRLHKMLDDGGIKLGAVVADINGVSARAMVRGLIDGQSPGAAAVACPRCA
jgi:transposase